MVLVIKIHKWAHLNAKATEIAKSTLSVRMVPDAFTGPANYEKNIYSAMIWMVESFSSGSFCPRREFKITLNWFTLVIPS
jgi:hypothetical protein